jgi:DNA repair protein RecN (Recombination protein N)
VLVELRIRDFAVVERALIEFGPGLNVLSGETGAGKSIIVDALSTVAGARATSEVVRAGAAAARVEARFAPTHAPGAARWLEAQGLADDELVVAREIGADGRSRAWINGRPATVGMLRELGEQLVEIIGQHEGTRLLRPATHLELLDAFAGAAALALRDEVAAGVARRAALLAEREALTAGERDRQRRVEWLRHELAEIDAARLRPGEDAELEARRARLVHAGRLAGAAAAAYAALYERDDGAAVDRLGQARAVLREAAGLDPALAAVAAQVDALSGAVVEVARELAAYRDRIEAQPDELEVVEERLAQLAALRRKYGATLEEVAAAREAAAAELARLAGSEERLAAITGELADLERALAAQCTRLSGLRAAAARRLEAGVGRELEALDLRRARLTVTLGREPDPDGLVVDGERVAIRASGVDRAEFLFTPNRGEEARPLAKIASGGELSRVALALRHVLAAAGQVPVMVCDEVDAGIGARTAGAVGALLVGASRARQVLCVTHLPQIASLADRHFWVAKDVARGRTQVQVRRLDGRERVEEIARMVSGKLPTPVAREYAVELLGQARRRRAAAAATRADGIAGGTR